MTRVALLLACLAALMNAATYFQLPAFEPHRYVYVMHVLVMLLAVVVFFRSGWHLLRTTLSRRREEPTASNRVLAATTAVTAVYLAVLVAAAMLTWGEGSAVERAGRYLWTRDGMIVRELSAEEYRLYEKEFMRIFSAGWLFFSMALATWNHNLIHRRRAARLASHVDAN